MHAITGNPELEEEMLIDQGTPGHRMLLPQDPPPMKPDCFPPPHPTSPDSLLVGW